MRKIAITDPAFVETTADVLRRGGVVVLPTDTLYGFSSLINRKSGRDRIATLKQIESPRGFVYLAASVDMVESCIASWGCTTREVMEDVWPAALTGVFAAGRRCPAWLGRTIALRVPDYEPARRVAEKVEEPILSTSVNLSGEDPLTDASDIERRFGDKVDLFVLTEATAGLRASTLVDFTGERAVVLRHGDYAWANSGSNPSNRRSL